MLYTKTVTCPVGNDTPENAVEEQLKLEEDAILFVQIRFPPGPSGLLYVSLWYGEEMIVPHKSYDWVNGDDEVVWDIPLWKFPEKPCPVTVKAYNLDTKYQHSAIVRIVTVNKWVLNAFKGLSGVYSMIEKIARGFGLI